jgi:superfamily II DNA or RNA helicase
MVGYIYIRNHLSYDIYNVCKVGKTSNIPERDEQYATSEIKRGYFESVFEVQKEKMGFIERLIHFEFHELNIRYDGGIEFYKKEIIDLIEPYLILQNFKYKKLTKQEISNLVRVNRVRKTIRKIQSAIQKLKNIPKKQQTLYIPRDYQNNIIENSVLYFRNHNKGILVLMCGMGKTLISLWITQALKKDSILIGVPTKPLLEQWEKVIRILFEGIPYLIVSDNLNTIDIIKFLKIQKKCIVITTYSSSHKVYTAVQNIKFVFSMKINDECHHLTTTNVNLSNTKNSYIKMLQIPSEKQLSLTATLKQLESDEKENIISNDNKEYFGDIIVKKCLLWAINEKIICDYVIQTILTNEEQLEEQLTRFNIVEEVDKRLFLSAFITLKSISDGYSHHLLIYSNSQDNSSKLIKYIKILLDDKYFVIPDLYYSNYHSQMKIGVQKQILENFGKAKYGIIPCVYCLGEGWDFPLLDGVVFSENMTSVIRIVQSALRSSRKYTNEPNKLAKIILPVLDRDDWMDNNNNSDLKKVREVICQMGLEDETVIQKIKVSRISIEKQKLKQKDKVSPRSEGCMFGEYDDELTQKLRLKTTKRTTLGITYEKAKKIIADKNIKNKEEYYSLCERDNRLSKEPEITFKSSFINWIDYLNIPRIYYELEICKNKVGEYLVLYPDLKRHHLDLTLISNNLCKIDPLFPPSGLWIDYYGIKDLRDIIIIRNKKKMYIK